MLISFPTDRSGPTGAKKPPHQQMVDIIRGVRMGKTPNLHSAETIYSAEMKGISAPATRIFKYT